MMAAVPWADVRERLQPFVAARVAPADVDDVLQDVLLRMHRGLPALADDARFDAWLYQVARSAIAEAHRARARHPLAAGDGADAAVPADAADRPADLGWTAAAAPGDDDRRVARLLAACLAPHVARLPSPYREAVTLVELEGLTVRAAAAMQGVTEAAMKSRVQRGRARLRADLEACCRIELDARGKVTDVAPRACPPRCGAPTGPAAR